MNIELIESVETFKTGVANMKIMLIISQCNVMAFGDFTKKLYAQAYSFFVKNV